MVESAGIGAASAAVGTAVVDGRVEHRDAMTGVGGRTIDRADPAAEPRNRDALIDRLSYHARTATETVDQPVIKTPGKAVGFVEAIAVDDSEITWIVGWMVDDGRFDRPMVILDNGTHGAGLAYATYPRDDLPPGSVGFVGILHTDWRASSELQPGFFLADGTARFLEAVHPTPFRTKAQIAPMIRDLLVTSEGGFREILRDLFRTVHSWTVLADPNAKDFLSVDEIAILPGFGAFVKGWSLSPSKEADRFALKAGSHIMVSDDRTVSFHSRPDLGSIYSNMSLAIERAGFIALFRGEFESGRLDEMILKTTWSDGSATTEPVAADKVRVFGLTVPIENVTDFYPAIEAEAFFPDFARQAANVARTRARQVKTYEAAPSPAAMLLIAPSTSSDVFLMIDTALRHAAALPADWGIAILARSDQLRPLVVSLFADLKRASGRACSLFFINSVEAATDTVSDVLDTLGATRFAFCGANAVLTGEGWRAAGAAGDGLRLFAIADLTVDTGNGIAGLDAFACDTATWREIARHAPARIGGATLETLPEHLIPTDRAVPGAALALAIRRPSPFVARINEIGGRHHG